MIILGRFVHFKYYLLFSYIVPFYFYQKSGARDHMGVKNSTKVVSVEACPFIPLHYALRYTINSGACCNIFFTDATRYTIILPRIPSTITHARYIQLCNVYVSCVSVAKLHRKTLIIKLHYSLDQQKYSNY